MWNQDPRLAGGGNLYKTESQCPGPKMRNQDPIVKLQQLSSPRPAVEESRTYTIESWSCGAVDRESRPLPPRVHQDLDPSLKCSKIGLSRKRKFVFVSSGQKRPVKTFDLTPGQRFLKGHDEARKHTLDTHHRFCMLCRVIANLICKSLGYLLGK